MNTINTINTIKTRATAETATGATTTMVMTTTMTSKLSQPLQWIWILHTRMDKARETMFNTSVRPVQMPSKISRIRGVFA